jgi:predicted nucleic acid-binding protein
MFPVQEALLADVQDAIRVHREHGISFWDGMLWSVTRRAGARILLSEDFQDGRDLEGVRFVDPFAERNAGILTDLI